ncbi:MAG: CPBP family intramembrane metalloprotease, partial [Rhodobacteraceae bacterium]|nr:CPBP family intramembrane metalloprotease [Paracoccaceae bacterium]
SILFGALHYAPSEFGANAFWPALWAGIFGCLAADLTARTGSLGAAMGFHFATNVSAIFLVGLYGNLDGLSLYTVVINTRDASQLLPYLAIDFASILVAWLVARLMLRV